MTPPADRKWVLSRNALDLLLERLAPDRDAAAQEYETLGRKLVEFFGRRRTLNPEVLADETVDRVAQKLEGGERIEHLRAYVYGVARWVHQEWTRRRSREREALAAVRHEAAERRPEDVEARTRCLERCLMALPETTRALILGYYRGVGRSHLEGRKMLANRLGVSYVGLKTRACRVRAGLEECLKKCLRSAEDGNQ